jgi:hypothetical protein
MCQKCIINIFEVENIDTIFYSLSLKIVFVLALDLYIYIQINNDESKHMYKTYI